MVKPKDDWSADLLPQNDIPILYRHDMRTESCRKCGSEMIPKQEELICQICKSPGKFICSNCEAETEIRFHMHFEGKKAIHAPLPILQIKR